MRGFISTPHSIARFSEIKSSRYLIWQLIRRDFTVRYKQTALGFLWALINPIANILLYFFVFGILVKIPTPEYNAPYAAVLLVGILLWNLFSNSIISISNSLVNNMGLIKKIYFPRMILSMVSITVSFVDFIIGLIFFIPVLIIMGIKFNWLVLVVYLPVCIASTLLLAWGLGCLLAILKVKYKDFSHVIPLVMQTLFYASPVVYSHSIVPVSLRSIYDFNPLSGIIESGRYALLGGEGLSITGHVFILVAIIIACAGTVFFLFNERKVVDLE